ncbi:response regulator [Polaromonas sp. P1-6]|nr:response regulator [Polaromonas sp. P1-6]
MPPPSQRRWICRPPERGEFAVLVADADSGARLYLRAKLAREGLMQVDEASTGAEALQLLETRCYKLIILDLDFPDTDSWQLVRQVGESRPAVDFLLLTGSHVSRLDGVRGWFAGARACMRKPLHPGQLKQLLRNAHRAIPFLLQCDMSLPRLAVLQHCLRQGA